MLSLVNKNNKNKTFLCHNKHYFLLLMVKLIKINKIVQRGYPSNLTTLLLKAPSAGY